MHQITLNFFSNYQVPSSRRFLKVQVLVNAVNMRRVEHVLGSHSGEAYMTDPAGHVRLAELFLHHGAGCTRPLP